MRLVRFRPRLQYPFVSFAARSGPSEAVQASSLRLISPRIEQDGDSFGYGPSPARDPKLGGRVSRSVGRIRGPIRLLSARSRLRSRHSLDPECHAFLAWCHTIRGTVSIDRFD